MSDIGRYKNVNIPRLSFLNTGLTLAYFHSDGKEDNDKFFCEKSTLDDSDHTPPDLTELQTDGLRHILITETEVEDILKIVDSSKATGPDPIERFANVTIDYSNFLSSSRALPNSFVIYKS
jgi:hypothetical protein